MIDALPQILNGTLKRSQFPEFCNLTLTYALYGKIVDNLKSHNFKQVNILPVVLKFLFPDLAQFLPPSIFTLTTQVRRFINKAYRLGHLKSLYQPVAKLYTAKSNAEWADFTKFGISQDMLVKGPLVPSSGCQMQLTNRHVILLLNLRNKYRLCWVKVVPQWLRFFGILQTDDCVQLQDLKGHLLELSIQADKLKGSKLQEFLNTLYSLPKSFIKKNIDPMTSSVNFKLPGINKKRCISAYLNENQLRVESLQKEVNKLMSQVTSKDQEISAYQKRVSQMESKLEHLSTRLCKMRLVKNHWLMKYRSMSGINIFAEDVEFNTDLTYAQKIREGARYIKRILQLRYSDMSTQFVENFLDDSFIEELLENILLQGLSFDKSSNILMEILQELVKHCQRKSVDKFEWQDTNNSDLDSLLMHSQLVPHENNSKAIKDIFVISDSDSSPDDNTDGNRINNASMASHDKTNHNKPSDLYSKKDSENLLKAKNTDTYGQTSNSSEFIQNEDSQLTFNENPMSGLYNDEEMLRNAYILYDTIPHKRTYDTSEKQSKDTGHVSQEDDHTTQPKTKLLRLQRQKSFPIKNSDSSLSFSFNHSPHFFKDETYSSIAIKDFNLEDSSKPNSHDSILSLSSNPNNKDLEFCKLQNDLGKLSDKCISSLEPNILGDTGDVRVESTTTVGSSSDLILTNSDPPLQTLGKEDCQEKKLPNSKINSVSTEPIKDKIKSPSNVCKKIEKRKKGRPPKKKKTIKH